MSNGVVEAAKGRPKADDFGSAVARMAVAQICESVGFHGFKESALDALTDVTIRYLRDLGKASSFYANLSGRTQCNIFDVANGFEDIFASQGFLGASKVSSCLASSGTITEIIQFVGTSEEIPFAQPVPRFPIVKDSRLIPSFERMSETPPGKHVPAWLPALPDPHTYMHTPVWNERDADPRAEKIEQARQRRKGERALLRLQQRLLGNGSAAAASSSQVIDNDDREVGVVDNDSPFLASPLKSGKRDVSVVALPEKLKNHISVMEAFAPAIEAAKEDDVVVDADDERKLLPEKRSAVTFKFKAGKKLLGESVSLSKKDGGRKGHWLLRDDERDDKKRRAEYILRQSIENPLDLMQL